MSETPPTSPGNAAGRRRRIGRIISVAAIASALLLGIIVTRRNITRPSTDDATARANVVGIAPRVSGPIVEIAVEDNQPVKQGDVLFRVDPRPYELALERALATKERIERQIDTTRRRIEAGHSGVESAASQVAKAEAQLAQASSTLARLEPLLGKKFVTEEQVEQARTAKRAAEASLEQARSEQARAIYMIDDLGALEAQLKEAVSAVANARLDLDTCVVIAPFPGRVINLNISKGAFAHAGGEVVTLLDARNWYVVANFRESVLPRIKIGTPAVVYLMEQPNRRFHGTVQGIGSGVIPEDGSKMSGLPSVQRTLNWVRLAQRFPVRIQLEVDPDEPTLRVGASAVVEINP